MDRIFEVDRQSEGQRLDRFLDDLCSDLSRSRLKDLIVGEHVTISGRPAKPATRLRQGETVSLTIPAPTPSHLEPQQISFGVVYQDSDILVVDKPAGLTVHPGPGHRDGTLVNAVLAMCPELRGVGGIMRPGIVHRLDKNSSGLMVVALNESAHNNLSEQIMARSFDKSYLALVVGRVTPQEAIIDAPIGRDPDYRQRMAIVTPGRDSRTGYRVTNFYKRHSLVAVKPTTGRTHQIRVHFASIGFPLVGDEIYGKSDKALNRHFLHADRLGFHHPSTLEHVEFTSDLPQELRDYLAGL